MIIKGLCLVLFICVCSGMHILKTNEISVENKDRQVDVDGYLEKYGYLPSRNEASLRTFSEDTRKHAIRMFQKFAQLPPTGEMDRKTAAKMRLPRCGFPDITLELPLDITKPLKLENSNKQPKWTNKTITWKIKTYSDKLTKEQQRTAMMNGLQRWQEATNIDFAETDGEANINIEFLTGDHGDGRYNAFDGEGGVLAHAFMPDDGRTHFDNDENWVFHDTNGPEIEIIATHEIGHALGLGHSLIRGSIMVPFYEEYKENFTLNYHDVASIQYIYGTPNITSTSQPDHVTKEPTKIPPTQLPGPETATEEPEVKMDKRLCEGNIDAAIPGPDGMVHLFVGPVIYKMYLNCHGTRRACIVQGFPKPIRSVFKKGPKRVHAALFIPDHRQRTYLIKGRKVWRYKGYKLEKGYPKIFSKKVFPKKPTAAFVQKNQFADYQMYIFGGKYFWELNLDNEDIVNKPMKTSIYWRHIPTKPDALFQTRDGNIYVFKRKRYNRFDHRRVLMEKGKLIVKDLLGVECTEK